MTIRTIWSRPQRSTSSSSPRSSSRGPQARYDLRLPGVARGSASARASDAARVMGAPVHVTRAGFRCAEGGGGRPRTWAGVRGGVDARVTWAGEASRRGRGRGTCRTKPGPYFPKRRVPSEPRLLRPGAHTSRHADRKRVRPYLWASRGPPSWGKSDETGLGLKSRPAETKGRRYHRRKQERPLWLRCRNVASGLAG